MTAHTSMRGGVNNYLILQYAKLIFGLYQPPLPAAVVRRSRWHINEAIALRLVLPRQHHSEARGDPYCLLSHSNRRAAAN
jgi:hypothetical protein